MNKYRNLTIESMGELIKFLNKDPLINEIIRNNNEIRGINNLTDALLDIDLLYSVYEIAEDEYLFDIDMIKENLSNALADAINKENIEDVKNLMDELSRLLFMHYEYFLFVFLGHLSDVEDIDMRDYTISILNYFTFLLNTNDFLGASSEIEDEIMYKEAKNIVLNKDDEDYEFKKVCYEASLIVLATCLSEHCKMDLKYEKINFVSNVYND